ncbi:MAG: nitrate reductase associated protein [Cyanobacteriota bacterium]|nr:nitrate reductase associated protein [Cyanobacteriota bacterium]
MSTLDPGQATAEGWIFAFEADFARDLRCIPMAVRRKLDLVGVKLGLPHWHRLSAEERQRLLVWPDDAEGLGRLGDWLRQRTAAMPEGEAKALPPARQEPWQRREACPEVLLEACQELGLPLDVGGWQRLRELERFALVKLSRPGHQHRNLPHALAEFGLLA